MLYILNLHWLESPHLLPRSPPALLPGEADQADLDRRLRHESERGDREPDRGPAEDDEIAVVNFVRDVLDPGLLQVADIVQELALLGLASLPHPFLHCIEIGLQLLLLGLDPRGDLVLHLPHFELCSLVLTSAWPVGRLGLGGGAERVAAGSDFRGT